MRNELESALAEAIAVAEGAPPPARSTLFDDVHAERPWNLTEQADRGR